MLELVDVSLAELEHIKPCVRDARILELIRAAHDQRVDLPPIILYREAGRLGKLDGGHRLAVARERGLSAIRALVVRGAPSDENRIPIKVAWAAVSGWPHEPLDAEIMAGVETRNPKPSPSPPDPEVLRAEKARKRKEADEREQAAVRQRDAHRQAHAEKVRDWEAANSARKAARLEREASRRRPAP